MKQEHFSSLLEETKSHLSHLKREYDRISRFRSIAALLAVIGVGVGYHYKLPILYAASFLCAVAFLLLLKVHSKVVLRQNTAQARYQVLKGYLHRFDNGWQSFPQDGSQFMTEENEENTVALDLDLLGRRSLFQFLWCGATPQGMAQLAGLLTHSHMEIDSIQNRQDAVAELSGLEDFSLRIQTLGRMFPDLNNEKAKKARQRVLDEATSTKRSLPTALRVLIWALPVITILSLILALLGIWLPATNLLGRGGLVLQLGLSMAYHTKNKGILGAVFSFYNCIHPYRALLEETEQANFKSEILREIKEALQGGIKGIRHLQTIGEGVRMRQNSIAFTVLNALFLWDFHCVDLFDSWKGIYGSQLEGWLEAVGTIEALISLGIPCQVRENCCFPNILHEQTPALSFKGATHPLLVESNVVENSFEMTAGTCIITGSNMSGKTTFLRCIGVNLVLAYAGGAVCAVSFSASRMALFTSMRVHDDVSQGISTFYAEILRIKDMVSFSAKERPMIALIDEIFKGTNSADRVVGAVEAVKKLSKPWCITLVSTHDFGLCDLEKDPAIHALNRHFSEYYQDNQILFDYKIKAGRCQTTNARYLLKMAGII